MNPAALKVHLRDVPKGGTVILNTSVFNDRNIAKAGYKTNPREDGTLDNYVVIEIDIQKMTLAAVQGLGLSNKESIRCKNMWALGLMCWMYDRDRQPSIDWLNQRFGERAPNVAGGQYRGAECRPRLWRDRRAAQWGACLCRGQGRGEARNLPRGDRDRGDRLGAGDRRAQGGAEAVPGLLPDHAGLGAAAYADQPEAVRRDDLPGRGRDRRGVLGDRRLVRRLDRRDLELRARHRAQDRGDRAGVFRRAAAGGGQQPARRPVDRPADQDRAVGPVPGGLWPQRRCAAAGGRLAHRRRLLFHRDRGDPASRSST